MENEIPVICLVYLERLLELTGILINYENWRRLTLISLCLASKIWDDDSLENVHFPKVMPEIPLKLINRLEQSFLDFLGYDLVVKGSEYAKYYFILRTLSLELPKKRAKLNSKNEVIEEEKEPWGDFPLKAPISAQKMLELQKNSAKAEIFLKERHEREFLKAIKDFQGPPVQLDKTI